MRHKNLKTRLVQIWYYWFLASIFGALIAQAILSKVFFGIAMFAWIIMEALWKSRGESEKQNSIERWNKATYFLIYVSRFGSWFYGSFLDQLLNLFSHLKLGFWFIFRSRHFYFYISFQKLWILELNIFVKLWRKKFCVKTWQRELLSRSLSRFIRFKIGNSLFHLFL